MKRLLIAAIIAATLTGCGVTAVEQTIVGFTDFRPYTEAGFFLSPDPYAGDFDPIGQLYVRMEPGAQLVDDPKGQQRYDDSLYGSMPKTNGKVHWITTEEALKKAVEMAKETGANGISNLKIMRETDNTGRLLYYEVTGFCIRIR